MYIIVMPYILQSELPGPLYQLASDIHDQAIEFTVKLTSRLKVKFNVIMEMSLSRSADPESMALSVQIAPFVTLTTKPSSALNWNNMSQ